MTCYINFRDPNLPSFDFRVLQMSCIWKNTINPWFPSWWIWIEMGIGLQRRILNFKRDLLYKFQGSKSSFFWLQSPPDVLYWKELHQIIISFMMNMIRNGEEDFREGFWISNMTCYINFRAPNLPSFDFSVLQMSCIWKKNIKSSWSS